MCIPKPWVYKPHTFFSDYPGLFSSWCYRTSFVVIDGHPYCINCFPEMPNEYLAHPLKHVHVMSSRRFPQLYCCQCITPMVEERAIKDCNPCFTDYLTLCGILRHRNYDPWNITKLLFNTITENTIILTLESPLEDENNIVTRLD